MWTERCVSEALLGLSCVPRVPWDLETSRAPQGSLGQGQPGRRALQLGPDTVDLVGTAQTRHRGPRGHSRGVLPGGVAPAVPCLFPQALSTMGLASICPEPASAQPSVSALRIKKMGTQPCSGACGRGRNRPVPVPGSPGLLEPQPLEGNEGQAGAEAQAQAGCAQPRGHPSSCLSWDRRLSLST